MRQTNDIIEQAGIQRSRDEAHKADIILLVIDGSRAITDEEKIVCQELLTTYEHKIIIVSTKCDKPVLNENSFLKHSLSLSSITGHNCNLLEQEIEEKIAHLLQKSDSPFLINKRHYGILLTLESSILHIIAMLQGDIQYELISHHLREALEQLSQLTGKTVSEAAMDMVFKEFCVGK